MLAPWRALSNRVLKTHRSLVSGRPERYAKHHYADESGVARREGGKRLPGAGWHCCASGRRTIGPSRSKPLLGRLLATPRFAAEQEPQRSGCPSRWEAPSSVLHHGAPGRRTTGGSSDTNSARKIPRPQHHAERPRGAQGARGETRGQAPARDREETKARAEDSHLPSGRRLRL